ncbi:MAG: GNAT family N-acetyltransferase, partial [Saprospiraceae bacterium]|nr:GNAT family N-acetyltransferase [Saprospiraceae bacterium]
TENHLVHVAVEWVRSHARSSGRRVQLTFMKDFATPRFSDLHEQVGCLPYHPFTAQPNMIMELPEDWNSFDDYLQSLTSKYRVRVRRARKKSRGILMRDLDVSMIEDQEAELYRLYHGIADRASFNLFILHRGYLARVKQELGERFTVLGYYDEGELVAFCSMMENGDELEAHFLGYEAEVNQARQLYLNMLLDMVVIALRRGIRRIVFSRTAMEIKSSVGAEPHYMYFYLQLSSAWRNRLIPRIYHWLDPKVDWTPRSPFKTQPGEG